MHENGRLTCSRIPIGLAKQFYEKYEHLGNPGRGVYHWGAYNDNGLVSAVSFGSACFALHRGIFADIARTYDLRVYQLTRGGTATFAPRFSGSWIISRSLRSLRELRGDSLVVAYSDRRFNEIGTIYQASNFVYLGMTVPKGQSDYVIRGKWMSGWKVRRIYKTRDMAKLKLIDPNVIRIPLQPKYRYVYPAVRESIRAQVLAILKPVSKPYPKREQEGVAPMDVQLLTKTRSVLKCT